MGYFVEFSLAVALAVTLLVVDKWKKEKLLKSCRKITAAYVDSAIALALSVELACAIMLIKKNFGLGVNDFGGLTVQLVWIVATLVMLPVVSFCWQDLRDKRIELRLCMTALAFILFLITFVCRMINTYSDRQIGGSSGAVITEEEAGQLSLLCFGGNPNLSLAGTTVLEVFSVGASLWISCNIILALVDQCVDDSGDSLVAKTFQRCMKYLKSNVMGIAISTSALMVWSIPLLWALMTLRSWQMTFTESIGETSDGDVWSFGQIIAVIVFLPVLNELLHQYLERNQPSIGDDGQQPGVVNVVVQPPKTGGT